MEGKTLKKIFYILIILILIFSIAFGEEEYFIQGIIFKGIKYTPYSQIQELFNINPFQKISLNIIEEEITRIRNLKIFRDVKYSLNKIDGGYELIIEIVEFPVINSVNFPKIRLLREEEIKRNIYSNIGKFFIPERIQEDIKKIKKLYEDKGYTLKSDPKFSFDDNILIFFWEELPPIKEIIFEGNNQKEKEILKEADIKIGEDFNKKKIELANQRLVRKDIPFRIEYNYKIEDDGTILYLSLRPLFFNSLNISLISPLSLKIGYDLFSLNIGKFSFSSLISKESFPLYSFLWKYEEFSLALENNILSLSYEREFRENFYAKVGYKLPLGISGNKSLIFSLERNTLIKGDILYIKGNLQSLNVDFVGGGSPENYTSLKFLSDNYWSYGEGLNERILTFQGELKYIIGTSSENSSINLKFSYGFPIADKNYILLSIGGDSNFKLSEVKKLDDIIFNLFGELNWTWSNYPWIFESLLIFRGPEKLDWRINSTLNF